MKVFIVENDEELAKLGADLVANQIKEKPNCVLGFSTGKTPLGLYKHLIDLVENKEISFQNIKCFNLDEYIGLELTNHNSFYTYMQNNLFNHIDIKEENIYFPKTDEKDLEKAVKVYNDLLKENPIDLQILGIGCNGHIGFNEPGTSFDSQTHIATLTEKTRICNQSHFSELDEVPKSAITMGIKNIMAAKSILLLISGKEKKEAVRRLLKDPISIDFPASILHKHNDITVLMTKDAFGLQIYK